MANGFLDPPDRDASVGERAGHFFGQIPPLRFARSVFGLPAPGQAQAMEEAEDILTNEAGEAARVANQGAARAANARGLTGGLGASMQAEAQGRVAQQLARDLANLKLQQGSMEQQSQQAFGQNVMNAFAVAGGGMPNQGGPQGGGQPQAGLPPQGQQQQAATSQQPSQAGVGQTGGQAGVTRQPVPVGAQPQGQQTAGLNLQGQQPTDMEGQLGPVQTINIGGMDFPQDPESGGAIVPSDVALELIRGNPGGFNFQSRGDGQVLLTPSNESLDQNDGGSPLDSFMMGFGGQ